MDRQTIGSRSEELLKLLKLEGVETKLAVEYSHGMKKKLALAAALLPNPDLLFLDEPFEGVDAVTARVIRDLLAKYVTRGSTVFVTSHVLEIVEKICTHVGIIANGKLVEQTSLDELRRGNSLEHRFLELVGTTDDETPNLSWLDGGRGDGNNRGEPDSMTIQPPVNGHATPANDEIDEIGLGSPALGNAGNGAPKSPNADSEPVE
jgi:ABC-2 type transport system ATP-binding protein